MCTRSAFKYVVVATRPVSRLLLHVYSPDPNAPEWMKSLSDRIVDRKKGLLQKMVAKSGDVAAMFHKFDADGSGYLDRKEFAAGLESLGFHTSNGEVDAICNIIDADQSGEISLEEFQAFVVGGRRDKEGIRQQKQAQVKTKISSARGYDGSLYLRAEAEDKTGALKRAQEWRDSKLSSNQLEILKDVRNKLANMYGPGGMTKAFRRFDADHDGSVSVAEFRKGMSDLGYGADPKVLNAICDSVDVDKSGNINYTEFARSLAEIDTEVRSIFGRGNTAELRANHGRGTGKGAIMSDANDYAGKAHMRMEAEDRTAVLRAEQRAREKKLSLHSLGLLQQIRSKISDVYGRNGITKAFRSFDKNHDGGIQIGEFRQGLANLGFGSHGENIEEIFRCVDVDGSGEVDVTEFARTLAEIDTEVRERFGTGDAAARRRNHGRRSSVDMGRDDYDHALEKDVAARREKLHSSQKRLLDEFMGKLRQKYGSHTMLKAFRQFDADRSGTISADEFRAGLQSLGFDPNSGDARAICNVIDADHDGQLEFEEFAKRLGQREEGIRHNFELGDSSRNVVSSAKVEEQARSGRRQFADKMRSVSLRRHDLSKRENRMLDALMQKLNMRFGRSGMTAAFRMFDKDKSGSVSVQEFQKSLHELGMHWSKGDVEKIATFVDGDSSGVINYEEFAVALKERDQAVSFLVQMGGRGA